MWLDCRKEPPVTGPYLFKNSPGGGGEGGNTSKPFTSHASRPATSFQFKHFGKYEVVFLLAYNFIKKKGQGITVLNRSNWRTVLWTQYGDKYESDHLTFNENLGLEDKHVTSWSQDKWD